VRAGTLRKGGLVRGSRRNETSSPHPSPGGEKKGRSCRRASGYKKKKKGKRETATGRETGKGCFKSPGTAGMGGGPLVIKGRGKKSPKKARFKSTKVRLCLLSVNG